MRFLAYRVAPDSRSVAAAQAIGLGNRSRRPQAGFRSTKTQPSKLKTSSPFWFTPAWPVEEMSVVPVVALVVVSLVLAAWGVLRFERRDIPG